MMHVDWQITAAVGCFFLGMMLLWLWKRSSHQPPKKYIFKAYVVYLVYLEKLKHTKWYQWRKRRAIDRWMEEEIKKAEEQMDIYE